ncbi:cannabinoid receptor 1-like [Branchiostoma floridae x Branchiostoma belcheri]
MTRSNLSMFNNSASSSDPWVPTETSAADFRNLVSCYKWHLQNNNVSLEQVHEACSMHEELVRLGTETGIVYWLVGLLIIICNAVVLLGIIRTRQLHKPIYIYLANLAVTDVFAGIALLYRTVGHVRHGPMYDMLTYISLIIFSQMISASALVLMSTNAYVAMMHPVYFHNHAAGAKLRAAVGLSVSWILCALLAFSPIMGWNCVQMKTLTTGICISWYPLAFVVMSASILLLLCIGMLFTNISVYVTIRRREKRRLEQAAAGGPQAQGPGQNNAAQEEAQRRYEERVYKARTVMIHVVVAFVCWLLALLLFAVCKVLPDSCPRNGVFAGICLNSLINPIATLIRMPDLRNAIWQKLTGIYQTLVTTIRGNRADPQEDQAGAGDIPMIQVGPAQAERQDTPRLAPDEQSAVGNRQEGPARGEGQDTPRLAPDEQSAVGNRQEGPARGEGQDTPRLAPDQQSAVGNRQEGPARGQGQDTPRLAPDQQSAVGNRKEGPARGEGQDTPRLAPDQQSAAKKHQIRTYHRTRVPYKPSRGREVILPTIVEID